MNSRLFLLGLPYIEVDGALAHVERRKVLGLIAYLVRYEQPYSREALATLFWPELDQSRSLAALRRTLSDLKSIIPADALTISRQRVGLRSTPNFWVDVKAFDEYIRIGLARATPELEATFVQSVEIYRGDFMEGFTLSASAEFDNWQAIESQALRLKFANALQQLVDIYAERSDYKQAISYAIRHLALDSLDEARNRTLMRLYAYDGQISAALHQYQKYSQLLNDELGIKPAEETVSLYTRIRNNTMIPVSRKNMSLEAILTSDPHGLRVATAVIGTDAENYAPLVTPSSRDHVPVQITPFVGRETELQELTDMLADPQTRLFTILAPGGMGKTRLAIEVANTQRAAYVHGVHFVPLTQISDPAQIVYATSEGLGFQFYPGSHPVQQLLDFLREKSMLIVFDNFEHILPGATLVTEILASAPAVKIIATSRERLNLESETLFRLEGMEFPDWTTPDDAAEYSAVKLFMQSARRVQPSFALKSDTLTHIAQICRQVQGMPLGILLAAAWVDTLSLQEISDEIARSLDFLESDQRDLLMRQRSIRAVFDYSWKHLTADEQAVFKQLTVFRGGFTREAIHALAGASPRTLATLINKSMLRRNPDGRYDVHELLRQYGAEQLDRSGLTDCVRDTHYAYFTTFMAQREQDLMGRRQLDAFREIGADFENVRIAWLRAIQVKDEDSLDRMLESLAFVLVQRGDETGRELFGLARYQFPPQGIDHSHRVQGRLLVMFPNPQTDMKEQAELSLAIARHHHDLIATARSLRTLAETTIFELNDTATGIALFQQSLSICRQLDIRWYLAHVLFGLGNAYSRLGRPDKALEHYQTSTDLHRQIGDKFGLVDVGLNLVATYILGGINSEADRLFPDIVATALEIKNETGNPVSYAFAIASEGLHDLMMRGNFRKARQAIDEALVIVTDANAVTWRMFVLGFNAFADLFQEKYIAARDFLEPSLHFPGYGPNVIWWQIGLCFALLGLQDYSAALSIYQKALETARVLQCEALLIQCLPLTSLLLSYHGKNQQAAELLAFADFQSASWHGILKTMPLITRLRTTLRSELGNDAFIAAENRAKTRQLDSVITELFTHPMFR